MEIVTDVLILGAKRIDFKDSNNDQVIKGTRVYFAEFVNDDNQKGFFTSDKLTSLYLKDDLETFSQLSKILEERKFQPFKVKATYRLESTTKLPKLVKLDI